MLKKITQRINRELKTFLNDINRTYHLERISPLLFNNIKEFMLRPGKRIRPLLFVLGYLGFSKRKTRGLYTSALAIELLHDFMLVHDDIIDKSLLRRGKPSMHTVLNTYLKQFNNVKFTGEDLSIVVGDVMYAMAIHAFLAIDEDMDRKEKALKKFIEAAIYTGGGEFIELLLTKRNLKSLKKEEIFDIYDYKTACYTFSCPLATGAMLAGAKKHEVDNLFKFGLFLGRAFQIKDDILGMFSEEEEIGKSCLTDLQEGKKTLLIWQAYRNCDNKNKALINVLLAKKQIKKSDLKLMRKIIIESKALDNIQEEIGKLLAKALTILSNSKMNEIYKNTLYSYINSLIKPRN